MTSEFEKSTRLPKNLGLLTLGVFFLLFTFAAEPTQSDSNSANINAHQVPWLRMIIPDTVVAEWAEHSMDRISIVDRLPLVLGSLLLLGAVLIIGKASLRLISCAELTRLELTVLAFGMGTITLTLFAFLIGVLGLLKLWWLYLIPLAGAVYIETTQKDGVLSRPACQHCWESLRKLKQLECLVLFCLFAMILAGAMLPPWEFDVREYHLQVPKEWFQNGRIEYLPHNTYAAMPLGSELICVVPMAWAQLFSNSDAWWFGALIGKTFLSYYALFASLGCWAIASRMSDRLAGAAAAILLMSCPWIGYISMTGLNEVALGYFLLMAIVCLGWMSRTQHSLIRLAVLTGVFVGAAASVKYTGLVFAILPIGVWLLLKYRSRPVILFVGFSIGAAITFGPWLVKNTIDTGNPVYPLMGTMFPAHQQTEQQVEQWNLAHQVPESDSLLNALSEWFLYGTRNSPLMTGVVLIAIGLIRQRREIIPLLLLLLYGLAVWWLMTHHLQRFLVPLLPVFAIVGGMGFSGALQNYRGWQKGLFVGLLVYGVMYLGAGMETDSRILVKLDLLRNGPVLEAQDSTTFKVHRYLNQQLGREGRVVLVGDAEPFDLEMTIDYNSCFDNAILADWLNGLDAADQRQLLQQKGIDYIYVSWEELDRYKNSYGYDERIDREWIQRLVRDKVLIENQELQIPLTAGQLFQIHP